MSDTFTRAEAHALFERLIDAEDADRRVLLDQACDGRPALRQAVESLLAIDATGNTLLDAPAEQLWSLLLEDDAAAPQQVGPYRIVRELGRGGMGVVYLAERADPELQQTVALKLISPRPDTDHLAERFRRERQILANLRHPNIAQLHDGGVTPEGLPYLAMEYVAGERIDRWCDARRLSVAARLRLFITVCAAVQHAQQNLIVHRDLKPANILVTADGVVKLLDFGIAKLLPAQEGPEADLTRTVLHALTPRYASPEQIRHGPIGTPSDVYALGVILHELLTGHGPHETATDPFEAARAVLERDPRPPSTVVDRAATLGTTPERLRRRLAGELDAIVLKALRKEPTERYATAAAMADDIRRHLVHEPITARPDTAGYRLRKFVRRRRGPVAAAAAILLLTAAFTAVHTTRITTERNRAELEAAKAQEARDFLLGLFTSSLPNQSLGEDLTLGDILERGVARTDSLDRPELRALLLTTLGDVYRVLGRYDRAQPMIERSIAEYRALATDELGLAGALLSLAMLHFDLNQYDEARAPTVEALEIQRRMLGDDDRRVLISLNNLAVIASNTGDADGALSAQQELLERRRRLHGPDDESVGVTLNNIGTLHYRADRLDDAERHFREALELRRRILPRQHPDAALSLNNLASVLRAAGRLEEAEPLFREALELRVEVLGAVHPSVAVSHYNLGRLLQMRGILDGARPHYEAALAIDRQTYGADHPEVGVDAMQLARLLAEQRDCAAADSMFAEAQRVFERAGRTEDAATAATERTGCIRQEG